MGATQLVTFKIKKINWRNENYAYVIAHHFDCKNDKFKKQLGRAMTIKGNFITVFEGDEFEGVVELLTDKKTNKKYLRMRKPPRLLLPEKERELAKFLHRRAKGLSEEKAKLIVRDLGLDCIDKITNDKNILFTVKGLNYKTAKIESIHQQLAYCKRYEECMIFIQSVGISLQVANVIYEKYLDDSIKMLMKNPYQICYDGDITFKIADRIANNCKIPYNHPMRIQTGILSYIQYCVESKGYTCLPLSESFRDEFNNYLLYAGEIEGEISDDEIEMALTQMTNDKKIIIDHKYLYTYKMFRIECNIAKMIKHILDSINPFCSKQDVDDYFNNFSGISLDPKQIDAIRNALLNNISILTGGPGTGKSLTVNEIVRAVRAIGGKDVNVVLLGPTGKAADRIRELTGDNSAATIHRKLGIIDEKFSRGRTLEADYVIIDEFSMVDVYLMEQLLSSIEDGTRLIFVGDINQLPSVGPGKILDDLIACGKIPTVTLTTIFRQAQGSTIVENAHHIINKEDISKGFTLNKGNFHFIEEDNSIGLKYQISKLISNHSWNAKDVSILCPMRDYDGGTNELNELFQDEFNNNRILYEDHYNNKRFKIGDRVIQTKNNYDLKVFNGFVGTISDIFEEDDGDHVIVDFDGKSDPVEYIELDIQELELAYAITIHKSQGSEYPIVIMPVHTSQDIMLTRKLFYTGVTRARIEIWIIGEKEAINKCINDENLDEEHYRVSRLADRI